MRHILTFVAVLLIAVSTLGQSSSEINVHVVELPVSVVDASGSPVRGLTAANFALYDEKKKQPITSFDTIDFALVGKVSTVGTAGALSPMNPTARRSFVLLFDLGFTSPRSMSRSQEAARRFVNESVGPRDLVAVSTVDPDRGFRFVTAFTTDRQLVASAIANPATFRGADPLQLANQTVIWTAHEPTGAATDFGLSTGGHADEAELHFRDLADQATRQNELAIRQRIEREIDSMGSLAQSLRRVPGRKQVVLLSEGFDARLLQGFDARGSKEQTKMQTQIVYGNQEKLDTDKVYGSASSLTKIERMADAFRASDVVLHAIDVQGVRVQNNLDEGSIINSNAGLFMVSRPTGGEVFQNSNDLHDNFSRLLRQQEVVYILGFHVPDSAPGTFHNVSVKLVNAPNGARVSQGAGYFEKGRDTAVERALTNAEIIVNDIPQHDLRINMLAVPFPQTATGQPARVPVIIDINGADLIRETSTTIGGADIFIYAFDTAGVVQDRIYERLTIEVAKVGEKVLATGIRYYGTLMLPPGSYAVKALVRTGDPDRGPEDVVEKRGYARVNITVPAEGQIAILPPIPIDEDGKWLLVRGNRGENAEYPFEYGGRTFSPTATADLSSGPRKVALFIFGAQRADLTFETRPQTKVLGVTEGNGVTKAVLQIDSADGASSLDVTVFKKGIAAGQHISVPLM